MTYRNSNRPFKNILMILQSDYPPDIRLTKEFSALHEHYNIFLLCNNHLGRPRQEQLDGATILRLPSLRRWPAAIGTFLRLPLFFNPLWVFSVIFGILRFHIDAIHVHDLPLAPLAIIAGKLMGSPVVYDMHENYPAAMKVWGQKGFINKLIKNPTFASVLDGYCQRHATKIIVVVEEQKENLIKKGIPEEKISIVSNTVDLSTFLRKNVDQSILGKYRASYNLVYVGSFSAERGLQIAIEAIKRLQNSIPNVKLVFVGDGKNRNDLVNIAKYNDVAERVEFTGWIDFTFVPSYIAAADICIIPQPSNIANDTTIPHKLFQYMALKKPVLTSDARPLARIVRETGCGEIFESDSSESFAGAVMKIYNSEKDYGENGRRAVEEKYNWQETAAELLKLYEGLTVNNRN